MIAILLAGAAGTVYAQRIEIREDPSAPQQFKADSLEVESALREAHRALVDVIISVKGRSTGFDSSDTSL